MKTINFRTLSNNLSSIIFEISKCQNKIVIDLEDKKMLVLMSKKEFDFIQNIINPSLKV